LVIQIIELAPEAVRKRDRKGDYPLIFARFRDASAEVVKYLLVFELFNLCLWARDATLSNERDAAFQEIREWLYDRHNPPEAAARYRNQERNSIALHVLVAARPPFDLVEQIIRIAPNTVCELTNNDRTALHIAIECKASPEVVQLLVNTDSNTAKKAV